MLRSTDAGATWTVLGAESLARRMMNRRGDSPNTTPWAKSMSIPITGITW